MNKKNFHSGIIFLGILLSFMFLNNHSGLYIAGFVFPYVMFVIFLGIRLLIIEKKIYLNKFTFIFTIILISVIVARMHTESEYYNSGVYFSALLIGIITILLSMLPITKIELTYIEYCIILSTVLISAITLITPFDYLGIGRYTLQWRNNVPIDVNFLGAYLALGITINSEMLKRCSKKTWFIFIIILQFLVLIRTGSRGGLLGALVGVFVIYFEYIKTVIKERIENIILFLAIGIIAVIIFYKFLPESVVERFFVLSNYNDGSNRLRILHWKYAVELIKQHPIIGHGMVDIVSMYKTYFAWGADAHNTFLAIWLMCGMFGIIPLIIMFGIIIKTAIIKRNSLALALVLIDIFIYFIINGHLSISFWITLIVACWEIRRQE